MLLTSSTLFLPLFFSLLLAFALLPAQLAYGARAIANCHKHAATPINLFNFIPSSFLLIL
jgi:hypothetical protein